MKFYYTFRTLGKNYMAIQITKIEGLERGKTRESFPAMQFISDKYPGVGVGESTIYIHGTDTTQDDRPIILTSEAAVRFEKAVRAINRRHLLRPHGWVTAQEWLDLGLDLNEFRDAWNANAATGKSGLKLTTGWVERIRVKDISKSGLTNDCYRIILDAHGHLPTPIDKEQLDRFAAACEKMKSGACRGVSCADCPGYKKYNGDVMCYHNGWSRGTSIKPIGDRIAVSATRWLKEHGKGYLDLCAKVEKIDPQAAEYMRNKALRLVSFDDAETCLEGSFSWNDTHQGHDYWNNISKILDGKFRLLSQAKDKKLFKEIFLQEWAKGKAERLDDEGEWVTKNKYGGNHVNFSNSDTRYRLPLDKDGNLPELKPLPCAVKLPESDDGWHAPYINYNDQSAVFAIRVNSTGETLGVVLCGDGGKTEQEAIMLWNQLQRAQEPNDGKYPKGEE